MAGNMLLNQFATAKSSIDWSRSLFKVNGRHQTNLLTGKIVPMQFIPVLPGDFFSIDFGAVLRSATMIAPVLTDIYIDVVAFWVPDRLVMNDFAQFLGENNTRAWTLKTDVDLPYITGDYIYSSYDFEDNEYPISRAYYADHFLGDHVGVPFGIDGDVSGSVHVSTLKGRKYYLVYNEWWRDENVIDPVLFSKDSGVNLTLDLNLFSNGYGLLKYAARLSDMFNRVLPAPQRGDSVEMPFSTDYLDVETIPSTEWDQAGFTKYPVFRNNGVTPGSSGNFNTLGQNLDSSIGQGQVTIQSQVGGSLAGQRLMFDPNGSLRVYLEKATMASINQLRYAIMLQRFYEQSARTGMREVEFYAGMWGVTSSDARFQRSELLCQKRFAVNVNQVIAQADSSNDEGVTSNLGDTGAYSITAIGDKLFSKTFTEYGDIIIEVCIRHANTYSSGWDPDILRTKFFDRYLPVFDHIGEEGVPKLYISSKTSYTMSDFIGFNPAWQTYRSFKRTTAGILAPNEPLGFWTLSTYYEDVSLTADFIEQRFHEFDRALVFPVAFGESTEEDPHDEEGVPYNSARYQWLIDFVIGGSMARIMSKDSKPGLLRGL